MSRPEQEVSELKGALEKVLAKLVNDEDTANLDRLDDILNRLDNVPMSLELLQQTLIGATVNKAKRHGAHAAKAKALIKKWKSIAAGNDNATVNTKSNVNSNGKKQNEGREDKKVSAMEGSSHDEDCTDTVEVIVPEKLWSHLNSQRRGICEKIYQTLLLAQPNLVQAGVNEAIVVNLIAPRSVEIEAAVFDKCGADKKVYTDKARSIFFNLKKNKNLCLDVCLGHVEPEELASYTPEQLADAAVLEARAKTAQRLIDSKRLDWEQANEDKINKQCGITGDLLKASLFTCSRCKSIKTTSTQKQTRSADEPMTVFVLCMNCGKRWKC